MEANKLYTFCPACGKCLEVDGDSVAYHEEACEIKVTLKCEACEVDIGFWVES